MPAVGSVEDEGKQKVEPGHVERPAVGSQPTKHSEDEKTVAQVCPAAQEPRATPPSVGSPLQALPIPALSGTTEFTKHEPLPVEPMVPVVLLEDVLEEVWRPVEPMEVELEPGSAQNPPGPA